MGLVLDRKLDESIMIGDDIEIVVVGFHGKESVQLSIKAPKEIPVHRREVWERIQNENKKTPQQ
jgi:carbon storage regulator